jgi:type IV pilus assembly protein PilA
MTKQFFKNVYGQVRKGFTLIEILVVIGIIAILAAIVIIAINPAKQFAQARNTQRESNVSTILNAVGQNIADNKGIFGGTCGNLLPVSTASSSINVSGGTSAGNIDLSCLTPTYIPSSIPTDPSATAGVATGYFISVDAVGRVMVCAPSHAEPAITPNPGPYCLVR